MDARRERTANTIAEAGPAGLIEREAALDSGQAALDSALHGRGELVAFTGPAGIGRSAILMALAERAAASDVVPLTARCNDVGRDLAFGAALQLFEQKIADLSERSDEVFAGRAALAAPLLTGEGLRDPGALLREAPQASPALTHALYRVAANLAAADPIVLLVDDLQWIDAESLRFLEYLAPRLGETAISILFTTRDGRWDGPGRALRLTGRQNSRVERLAPLSKEAVRKLVTVHLGSCSPQCGEASHWLTGGNPLLVRELIEAARASGLRLDGASAAEICAGAPDRVRHRLLGPLGELSDAERAVARAAAVLGSSVDRGRVAQMTGLDDQALSGAATSLEAAGLLDPDRPFDFVHPLLRAATYSQVPREERANLHARAATVLRTCPGNQTNAVASHLLRTRPHGQAWVVDELLRAARAARANGELDRAILCLGRALGEPPGADVEAEVLLELARAEIDRGDLDAAVSALRQASDLVPRGARPAIAIELGRALRLAGDPTAALAQLDRAFSRPTAAGGGSDALEAAWLAAALLEPAVMPAASRRISGMNGVETRDAPALLATVAAHLAVDRGPRKRVVGLATSALAEHRPAPDADTLGPALAALCWTGEFERAGAIAERLAAQRAITGSRRALGAIRLAQAHAEHLAGDLEAAEAHARSAVALVGGSICSDYPDSPEARLAEVLLDRGDRAGAEAALDGVTGAPYPEGAFVRAQVLAARARVDAAARRYPEAFADATAAGRLLVATGVENPAVCAWRSLAALAAAALDERDRAAQFAHAELELARAFGADSALGLALATHGALASGHDAVELMTEAVTVLARAGARVEHARALCGLGAALRHHGSLGRARETLKEALDAASSLGAEGIAEQVRFELNAAGSRPRCDAATGAASLTPAEQRVTELAADGLSNRQIAQELYVTKKTVEWHLSNAFRKLDVASRDDLAAALATDAGLARAE